MPVAGGPKITKTGILLEVDAANASSYTSGSSTWVNVFNPGTRNGTINGTLGFNQDDSKGALTFPGTASSYVDFGNIGDLSVSWSFQVAVKPAPSASGNYTILSYASGSNTGSWTYKLDYSSSNQSAVLSVYSATGSTQIVHQVTGSVPTGSWSIINASYGNTVIGMYVNGQPTDYVVTTGSTAGYNSSNRLYLGGTFGLDSGFYTGSMASFFSYNTDVPNTQLVQNYNAYGTRFGLPPSVLAPVATDPDALRFISIAEITDPLQALAVSSLVVGLKGYGLWDKMVAIYPFVGGTAYSHKYNLKNTILNQLRFLGGITHDSNGYQPDGGPASYATTTITNNTYTSGDYHLSLYTNQSITGSQLFSADVTTTGNSNLTAHRNNDDNRFFFGALLLQTAKVPPYSGFHVGSRISTTSTKYYKDGINTITNTTLDTNNPGTTLVLSNAAGNIQGFFASPRAQQFTSIGLGLTDADVSNLYTLVQAYQTTLGRQV